MRLSTIFPKAIKKIGAWAFWILAWHLAAIWVDSKFLIASPLETLRALIALTGEPAFIKAVAGSLSRVAAGFALGAVAGATLGAACSFFKWLRELVYPVISVVKAAPVASFVILALIWISSKNLSVFISFLMVMPIMYENTLAGFTAADAGLLEMARAFDLNMARKMRAIYLPGAYPHILSACRLSIGMCWKAGIAAEVIAQPKNSIGAELYLSKVFFDTPGIFAWTAAIIIISVITEKIALAAVGALLRRRGDA